MNRFFILFLSVLLLEGCGGGGSSESSNSSEYPLHRHIKTTWFYVGELGTSDNGYIPNIASAWDDIWLWHYGGVDNPYNRTGYYPSLFTPSENPFYVALPYDDLYPNGTLKPSALKIPWFSWELYRKNGSVMKNRWVRIIKDGKVAYAQVEDVGPFESDDFNYVFGNAPPSNPVNGAGLDVSPAVRDYLGLKDVDYVDWQFVDDDEVPDGPWKEIVTTTPVTFIDFPPLSANYTFYVQLMGNLRTDVPAKVYEVDLFDTSEETIKQLQNEGKTVICYFSAGTYEDWRPDAGQFPSEAIGKPLENWEGEYWLDIRNPTVREITKNRIILAKEKGCDGVDPDNVDGYTHDTGFPLTYKDQYAFNAFLAKVAKENGLLIALKNDGRQVGDLVELFDFAVVEQCYRYGECDLYTPFAALGKPVYDIEYDRTLLENDTLFNQTCKNLASKGIQMSVYPLSLNGSFVKSCQYGSF